MTPDERTAAVRAIHDAPVRVVLMLAGGTAAVADLMSTPGGSRTMFETLAPYSRPALASWLGYVPTNAVTEEVAQHMAIAAAKRVGDFVAELGDRAPSLGDVYGLSVTSALATDPPRRGDDRAWLAVAQPSVGGTAGGPADGDGPTDAPITDSRYVTFSSTERAAQERELADVVLSVLLELAGG